MSMNNNNDKKRPFYTMIDPDEEYRRSSKRCKSTIAASNRVPSLHPQSPISTLLQDDNDVAPKCPNNKSRTMSSLGSSAHHQSTASSLDIDIDDLLLASEPVVDEMTSLGCPSANDTISHALPSLYHEAHKCTTAILSSPPPTKTMMCESSLSLTTQQQERQPPCTTHQQPPTLKQQLITSMPPQITIDNVEQNMGTGWHGALQQEFGKPYFVRLRQFLKQQYIQHPNHIYPSVRYIFEAFRRCQFQDVKVVILGQDPYHGQGQAHGLAFSVQRGIPIPPSLINIYKELERDIVGFVRPNHGCLTRWADQGVLLLNTVLTVQDGQAHSHRNQGWEQFTDAVLHILNDHKHHLVFLLWGTPAQRRGACIDEKRHYILTAAHPSPLSAHKGFFGCKHFSQCNQYLAKHNKKPIQW